MLDADLPRLVLDVELVSAAPIEGTDRLMVTLRTRMGTPLELRLTRAEAADFVALMAADRHQARCVAARS